MNWDRQRLLSSKPLRRKRPAATRTRGLFTYHLRWHNKNVSRITINKYTHPSMREGHKQGHHQLGLESRFKNGIHIYTSQFKQINHSLWIWLFMFIFADYLKSRLGAQAGQQKPTFDAERQTTPVSVLVPSSRKGARQSP